MAKSRIGDWLTEDGLQKIESWARRGLTYEQIASNMGISERTFYSWLKPKRDPDLQIAQALKKGRQVVEFQLENALVKKALGYTEKNAEVERRITVDENGNKSVFTVEKDKTYPGDTGALIFLLKNRLKNYYQDRPKTEEELEAIRLDNEQKRLKNELLQKALNDENIGILKIDELIGAIDATAIKDAE